MKRIYSLMVMLMLVVLPSMSQDKGIYIEPNMMTPMKFPSKMLDSGYYLKLQNDTLDIHLPYMGETYSPVFHSDGLNFKEPVSKMKVQTKKKKDSTRTMTYLEVSHDGIRYRITLTTWGVGSNGDIDVNPNNGSSCSYRGDQLEIPVKK